jgi:hypothetical protein
MLTISKPLNSGQAQTYHAKEFTSAEQNYWKQGDTVSRPSRRATLYAHQGVEAGKPFEQLQQAGMRTTTQSACKGLLHTVRENASSPLAIVSSSRLQIATCTLPTASWPLSKRSMDHSSP